MSAATTLSVSADASVRQVVMLCRQCGATFEAASPWSSALCSDACRRARRTEQNRARDRVREGTPARLLATRQRCAAWHAAHGGTGKRQPWLAGAPPFAVHLPGVSMSIAISPAPRWPIELRNTRALHGALTTILDVGHGPRFNRFALRQTDLSPCGWAVHWWHERGASLASQSFDVELYSRQARITLGPAVRLRAPRIPQRGRRRLRVETITPVCIVSCRRTTSRTSISADNLRETLAGEWLSRFGVEYLKEQDLVRIEVAKVHREQEARVELGSKFGTVLGWEGVFEVETNAPGHWLLETASRVGLGSRTAFGFGRVRVTEVTR